jgi:amino acid adenylation domain-containing protein
MTKNLLQQLVSAQADQRPEALALVLHGQHVTYRQLEEWSNQLARLLKDAGCQRGDRVCLLLPKSIPAIVSILGTLKADCVYVPMDPSSPAARLQVMIETCEARCLVTSRATATRLREVLPNLNLSAPLRVGWMEPGSPAEGLEPTFTWEDLAAQSPAGLDYRNTSLDVAHILFTSGSTGVPKGVMITHSNVHQFVRWAVRYFDIQPGERNSGHPPLVFDLSTFDIYGTLSAGATLYLVTPEMSVLPNKLADFIREAELTQWFSVPSLLNYMAKFDVVRQNDFPAMKRLLWCGEAFPTPALIYWMQHLPHVRFTNLYGPTEATIASSYYTVPGCPADESALVPIGAACEGEELMILDDQLRPVPTGDIGDLFIRGVGLSPGYWRDPEKTNAVFLRNPFSTDPQDRIYRTGDLASAGADGLIYLHGRSDSQIKSRGYRIELGEIERALHAIEGLRESAVVAVDVGGFEGATICCAYALENGADWTPASLRKRLGELVPSYMIPAQWLSLPCLPQNLNGKIDRKKLREQFQAAKQPPVAV